MIYFVELGWFFYEMIELSKLWIFLVCVVFGSFIVGGAYQFGLSDYVIVIKEQLKIFLVGLSLVKMVTGEEFDDEILGGVVLYVEVLGFGDYFAEDEMDTLQLYQKIISHLNIHKPGPEPSDPNNPPKSHHQTPHRSPSSPTTNQPKRSSTAP
jgi:Acetyl-CoA carboxylase, carboxyltransferase component (subunits alpha and beta)